METFPVPRCSVHPDVASQYLSFQHQTKRICTLCPRQNNRYTIANQSFSSLVMSAFADFQENEGKAIRRHQELTEIAAKVKEEFGEDDEDMLKVMIGLLENENRLYREYCGKVEKLKGQLTGVAKMLNYFQALKEGGLFEMKLNMASEQGLRKFYKKCNDYAALIKKGVHGEFKKISEKLSCEEKKLQEFQAQSIILKLKEHLLTFKRLPPVEPSANKNSPSPSKR